MKVAVTGFLRDQTGFGESARRVLHALEVAGAEVAVGELLSNGGPTMSNPWLEDLINRGRCSGPREDVHLIYTIAPDFPIYAQGLSQVGMTCWETDQPHEAYIAGCLDVARVIVPSSFNLSVFKDGGIDEAAIAVVPFATAPLDPWVDALAAPYRVSPETFVFYSMLSWQERKNPIGTLLPYLTTFSGFDDVLFVLKVNAPAYMRTSIEHRVSELVDQVNVPNPPKVQVIVGTWVEEAIRGLHLRGDCYVHLTRGEAYGLTALDALSFGNQIIATDWSGHLEFLTHDQEELVHGMPGPIRRVMVRAARAGVQLVESRLTPVVQSYPYFNGKMAWADPDSYKAGEAMQKAVANGRSKIRHDLSNFSPEVIGRRLLLELENARGH